MNLCFLTYLDEIHDRGVVVPVKRTIYKPILNQLKREGISWSEKTVKNRSID